jgi:hypothetical protein
MGSQTSSARAPQQREEENRSYEKHRNFLFNRNHVVLLREKAKSTAAQFGDISPRRIPLEFFDTC